MSPSVSPSVEPTAYTRGDEAALPGDDADLETVYSAQDDLDVETKNDVRVSQDATGEYTIHQYKDDVGVSNSTDLEWEGQTNNPPSLSTVYLQIYNRDTPAWETVDSDNTTGIDTDFTLSGNIADLTDYKDGSNIISCRIYQEAT